jgi:HAMP domain-containing protein
VIGLFKSSIGIRIFIFAVIPFMLIYGIISVFIGQAVFRDKIRQTKVDVETLAYFNETNLQGYIEEVRLVVKLTALQLADIDSRTPDARGAAKKALFSCFENWRIYNGTYKGWFFFEPDAFDGRNAAYPGAPPPRFMHSFIWDKKGGFLMDSDMDETVIDDPGYAALKQSGRQYLNITAGDLFYDYPQGEKAGVSVSVVYPVLRGGVVIGCVGGAFLLDQVILGQELIPGAQSALFGDAGEVSYAENAGFRGKTIEELGFPDPEKIRRVFTRGESLWLSNEYSGLLNGNAYSCFMPVPVTGFDEILYIYAAIPASMISEAGYAIFKPVALVLAATFILFTFLIFYLANSISEPIRELTAAGEAISEGNFDGKFGGAHHSGEIGAMTRSLYRMIEQFRMYITLQERTKELLDIYTRLYEALYQRNSIEDVFSATIFIIADYFKIKTASLILLKNEIALYAAQYTAEKGLWKMDDKDGAVAFDHHSQILSLLAGRKYIYLNAYGISEQKISFIAENTTSLCILPVRIGELLRGYFLIEGNEAAGAFVHYDDALVFISDTLSYILKQKEDVPVRVDWPPDESATAESVLAEPVQAESATAESAIEPQLREYDAQQDYPPEEAEFEIEPEPEADELPVIQAARNIPELDVDRGLSLIRGMENQYGKLLRISAKVFAEGIRTLREQCPSDLPGFAIGIHGMKGALYNIGAQALGDAAKELEFAAKGGDAGFCQEAYPSFEDRLAALARDLAWITQVEAGEGEMGNTSELRDVLEKALEACRNFDILQAGKIIAPVRRMSWESEDLGMDVKAIGEALENIDYDAAEALIVSALKKIGDFENESQPDRESQNSSGGFRV